jgi:hypothetical protein
VPDPILRPSDCENLAGQDTGREHLSHSRLNLFLACHEKYNLHYNERLEPVGGVEALSLGSAFQKAIELQDPEVGPMALDGFTVNGASTVGGVHPLFAPPAEFPHFHTQEAEDKHRVNQAIVRAAAALYLRTWPAPQGERREFEFLVRLRNPWTGHYSRTFDLLGYADGLEGLEPAASYAGFDIYTSEQVPPGEIVPVRNTSDIPLALTENKLVGQVSKVMVQRLPLDRQLQLLRYGVWRATGRTVSTVNFRWIKKPSIKQRQKETIEEFCDRIAEDYETRPDFYAYEPPASYITAADLLRIECELWTWAEQLRQLRRQRIYDRNTSACSDYGGCKYIPICSGDPDADSLYRIRPERTA